MKKNEGVMRNCVIPTHFWTYWWLLVRLSFLVSLSSVDVVKLLPSHKVPFLRTQLLDARITSTVQFFYIMTNVNQERKTIYLHNAKLLYINVYTSGQWKRIELRIIRFRVSRLVTSDVL